MLIAIIIALLVLSASYIIFRIVISHQKAVAKEKRILNTVVFKVLVPRESSRREDTTNEREPQDFREALGPADQFFASLSSQLNRDFRRKITGDEDYFTFEIVSQKNEINFYIACSKNLMTMLEYQVQSFYPNAQLERIIGHNIFESGQGSVSGAEMTLTRRFIFPIKTYRQLDSDPLNNITNTMSKLGENSSASVQIIVKPISNAWRAAPTSAAKQVMEGKTNYMYGRWKARAANSIAQGITDTLSQSSKLKNPNNPNFDSQGNKDLRQTPAQEELMRAFSEKSSKPGFQVLVRIVAVSSDEKNAQLVRDNIISAFGQYNVPNLNSFKVKSEREGTAIIKDYILRNMSWGVIFNSEEVASLWHLPNRYTTTPNIRWMQSRNLPPPLNLPVEGVVIGKSFYRGEEKTVRFNKDDRCRHMFMIGKTGVGKTTLFENMLLDDISRGNGVCFIDPLGDAIETMLKKIPAERVKDVILFDPSDTQYPMGLNLLDWKRPEEKDFLIAEWLEIFYKLFDPGRTGIVGPQFEHWGRNAALSVMSLPEGGTLIDIPRMVTDDEFREKVLKYVKDPMVTAFWEKQLAKTADFHKSEMYNYFISKFGRFMTNELMRNIIGQTKSAIDFRRVMDEGKILLINLSKGKIGEMNSYLLGMVIISKLQAAAFSRADTPEAERRDFYLYVDEFQNFTTDSFATILSEARKYRLSLNITNQYIAQLTEKIRDAVIGNAGTMIAYRIGASDAEFMAKEFPGVTIDDLVNLDRFHMYIKLLVGLTPSKPFSMIGIKNEAVENKAVAEAIRQNCRVTLAKPRAVIEKEIVSRGSEVVKTAPAPEPIAGLRQS